MLFQLLCMVVYGVSLLLYGAHYPVSILGYLPYYSGCTGRYSQYDALCCYPAMPVQYPLLPYRFSLDAKEWGYTCHYSSEIAG